MCHGYDEENFPFVIVTDRLKTQVFLVNVNNQKQVPLIDIKKVHDLDAIYDIK